ncbi:MAG: hypothetical protein JXA14_10100 [Anaerolineae bacterium]|nr:hypothetical protein [Anaerolineae bacterium]
MIGSVQTVADLSGTRSGDRSERNLYLYTKCGYGVFRTERLTDKTTIVFFEKVPHDEEPRYTLESLVAGVTVENSHGELDTGVAVGGEVWCLARR